MANWNLIISHILKFEGGTSADPDDNALKLGHSGVKGSAINPGTNKPYDARHPNNFIHTNKGVIWATYKTYKQVKKQTPSAAEFLRMDRPLWEDIYKVLFWDKINGDLINSQAIAEAILSAFWGGGGKTLVIQLQRYLNNLGARLSITGTMNINTVNAVNTYLKTQRQLTDAINYLYKKRMEYLRSLDDWWKYGRGWTRRMNAELKRYYEFIKSSPAFSITMLLPVIAFFFVYKLIKK